jgi:hypothetical protein
MITFDDIPVLKHGGTKIDPVIYYFHSVFTAIPVVFLFSNDQFLHGEPIRRLVVFWVG